MVSSPSLDYEPEDENQYQIPAASRHLPDFTQPEVAEDPLKKARDLLDELLDMSCEVPLYEVNDLAADAGVKASEILGAVENSETCFVDWMSGHIRCNDELVGGEDDGYES
jgi:hypothetical protein